MPEHTPFRIALVGVGPRGLSVLERLCANLRHERGHAAVVVHVIDPFQPGPGAVWRRDQSRHLLMNTVASQITAWTDASSQIDGPIEPGPNLHDWARTVGTGPSASPRAGAADIAEAAILGPDSYPTRALYGCYLSDCFDRVLASAPEQVSVRIHRSRAVAMAHAHGIPEGPQGLRLADGTRLDALDAIVLAQGHLSSHLGPREARTASLARIHRLAYIPPCNPADAQLQDISPGEPVLLRGLGLNFFDYMALLTEGKGGRYSRQDGRLRYEPSGEEPLLFAFSRRGVPHHARGENEKGIEGRHTPRLLTPAYLQQLQMRAAGGEAVDFAADLWPRIAREVESVYYERLLTRREGHDQHGYFLEEFLNLPLSGDASSNGRAARLLDEAGIAPQERWNWRRLARPCEQQHFTDRDEFRGWLLARLAVDVAQARRGNVSGPLKAALDVLRDLRNEIRCAVEHGALDGASHREDLQAWYTPLNAFLSIGPPASRVEEMAALVESGRLTLTGPGTRVGIDTRDPAFIADSSTVPGPSAHARILIEARLPEPDLRRTNDPLLQHLWDTEQATTYTIPTPSGPPHDTGGLAVTPRPYRLLDAQGQPQTRRFAYGVPTEGAHWVTAAGTRPGVDSVTLSDADAIARAVLALAPAQPARRPAAPHTLMEVVA